MKDSLTENDHKFGRPLNRREFLYYLWGCTMAVFMGGVSGVSIWFALPRIREGEFGGVFHLRIEDLPSKESPPIKNTDGKYWLSRIDRSIINDPRQPPDFPLHQGVRAIYDVCTHLGCIYRWEPTNDRFECPCHGSKFLRSGARIGGPARRNLDVFVVEAIDSEGNVLARTEPTMGGREGTALAVPEEAVALRVDTGRRILGAPNTAVKGGLGQS